MKKSVARGFSFSLKRREDVVGAVVLGAGVLALLFVLGFWLKGRGESGHSVVRQTQGVELDDRVAQMREKIEKKLPQGGASVPAALAEIEGSWKWALGDMIAVLTIKGDFFQIIYTADKNGVDRRYSRGMASYDSKTGAMTLSPRDDAGVPEAVKGVVYSILTMRPYTMTVVRKAGQPTLYLVAPEKDIPSKQFHPLFLYADYSGAPVLKWEKI